MKNYSSSKKRRSKKRKITFKLSNLYIYFFLIIIESCSNTQKKEDNIEFIDLDNMKSNSESHLLATHFSNKQIDSLTAKVYKTGDENAFFSLSNYYSNFGDRKSFLKVCKFMSDSYNNPYAQYLIYEYTTLEYRLNPKCDGIEPLECMPESTRKTAIEYLKKSIKNNYNDALIEYQELKKKELLNTR